MCLTVPGRIESIRTEDSKLRTATIDYGSQRRTASLLYLPEARVGDYVVVQAGYATARIDEREAQEALRYADELHELAERASASPTAPVRPKEDP